MSEQAQIERAEFSERLKQKLCDAEYPDKSPTQLAREFNARFHGSTITVHAARKWLVGEAIPTQEKIRVLAEWLGVTHEWLRYGDGEAKSNKQETSIDPESIRLMADIKLLDPRGQKLAREFVRMLVRETV